MKKIIWFLTFYTICLSGYCLTKPQVTFFYSSHCKSCLEVKTEILSLVKQQYKDVIEWEELNTSGNSDNLSLLTSVSKQFNKQKALVPAILVGDSFLVGKQEIKQHLDESLQYFLKTKNKPFKFSL